jgi:hypothetical protein
MESLIRISTQLVKRTEMAIRRSLYSCIDWSQPLIGIRGSRGVGKTTMVLQRIKDAFPDCSKALYVSLDNVWFGNHSLIELADRHLSAGGTHLFLDEVHRYPGWVKELKNIYDSFPDLHVVFTGSSLLALDNSIADLSRRCVLYDLPTLSFREFMLFEGLDVGDAIPLEEILTNHEKLALQLTSKYDVLKLFKRYAKCGAYPFYRNMRDNDTLSRVNNMVSTVIDYDIPSVERVEYETLFKAKRLLTVIAESSPFLLNVASLCSSIEVNRNQLIKLFNLLDKASIIRQVFYGIRGPKSVAKPQKVLFDNTTIMNSLCAPEVGNLRESLFASLLSVDNQVNMSRDGDFIVNGRYLFEIGGRRKSFAQIRDIPDSYVVADDIEIGFGNKIPLWLFGFLY